MKRKIKPRLNPVDSRRVQNTVESEGSMDYAFRFYTHFPEIKDKKFRKLYKAYIKAAQELADYCGLDEEPTDAEIEAEEAHEAHKDSCPNCGDDLDDDGTCFTCGRGAKITEHCPTCGEEFDGKVCGNCEDVDEN
jgi:hypothetical protein